MANSTGSQEPEGDTAASAQPQDDLFQRTFFRIENAAAMLRTALPSMLAAEIDFRTLRRAQRSYVDDELRHLQSDMVFSARMLGRLAYFYVLIEERREAQPSVRERLFIYMRRLWDDLVREQPDRQEMPLRASFDRSHSLSTSHVPDAPSQGHARCRADARIDRSGRDPV
ncbi:MAG TPA: Rpn family recombination-promoting nuclease/putative transposase [Candidatus Nanopelagicales bacterium]|nr:Rpn family recombination-promoting nuclease/putative transposase [Candidatus Nanopelagicales bacterium]